jgi:hypothetical protein
MIRELFESRGMLTQEEFWPKRNQVINFFLMVTRRMLKVLSLPFLMVEESCESYEFKIVKFFFKKITSKLLWLSKKQ